MIFFGIIHPLLAISPFAFGKQFAGFANRFFFKISEGLFEFPLLNGQMNYENFAAFWFFYYGLLLLPLGILLNYVEKTIGAIPKNFIWSYFDHRFNRSFYDSLFRNDLFNVATCHLYGYSAQQAEKPTMKNMKIYLEKLIHFNESEMDIFASLFSEIHLKKNDYFAKEGEYSSKLAFVSTGVLRAFFRNKSGKEYNKTFFTPSNFVAAYSSITTQQKNLIDIQCLTDCTLLVADFRQLTALYKEYPKFESLARMMAEYKFAIKEKREIEIVTLEATERYAIFKEEHPDLENLINQYHIASYLGITPTQLSRIRAKK